MAYAMKIAFGPADSSSGLEVGCKLSIDLRCRCSGCCSHFADLLPLRWWTIEGSDGKDIHVRSISSKMALSGSSAISHYPPTTIHFEDVFPSLHTCSRSEDEVDYSMYLLYLSLSIPNAQELKTVLMHSDATPRPALQRLCTRISLRPETDRSEISIIDLPHSKCRAYSSCC